MLYRGLNYGVDIRKEPMMIYPSSHYQNGGVKMNKNWEQKLRTSLQQGETARAGRREQIG